MVFFFFIYFYSPFPGNVPMNLYNRRCIGASCRCIEVKSEWKYSQCLEEDGKYREKKTHCEICTGERRRRSEPTKRNRNVRHVSMKAKTSRLQYISMYIETTAHWFSAVEWICMRAPSPPPLAILKCVYKCLMIIMTGRWLWLWRTFKVTPKWTSKRQ